MAQEERQSLEQQADVVPADVAAEPPVLSPPNELTVSLSTEDTAMREPHAKKQVLASEKIVVSAPLSFDGSAARIWRPLVKRRSGWVKLPLGILALLLILLSWCFVLVWYCAFGIVVVPYRLIRRGHRKRKRQELQHREMLEAMQSSNRQ